MQDREKEMYRAGARAAAPNPYWRVCIVAMRGHASRHECRHIVVFHVQTREVRGGWWSHGCGQSGTVKDNRWAGSVMAKDARVMKGGITDGRG